MKTTLLNNNLQMPLLGLGTWKSETDKVYNAVRKAIEVGYKHIDCAFIYGNENAIGNALNDAFKAGDVKREDIWITSKLWNTAHKAKDVKPAIENTLKDLQLDYLDLYLIHWPVIMNNSNDPKANVFVPLTEIPLEETWEAMLNLKSLGLSKTVGVSNFNSNHLSTLKSQNFEMPSVNQVESHPYLVQNKLMNFCKNENIHLTAYCPLAHGNNSNNPNWTDKPNIFQDEIIAGLASKYNATVAQILINWQMARNWSVIPKSTNEGRIQENFDAQNIALTADEIESINNLDKGFRVIDGTFWCRAESCYTLEELWGTY